MSRRIPSLCLCLALVAVMLAFPPGAALAGGKAEKKKPGGDAYLAVDTLTGTTLGSSAHRGVMTVECGLDVPDSGLRQLAEQSLPRLRAAYAQTVRTYAAGLPAGSVPNADFLARTMQRETDTALGRPGARVLLGAILVN
jgi:hypothetical protein